MIKHEKAQKLREYLIKKNIKKGHQKIDMLIQECNCTVHDIIVIALKEKDLKTIQYIIETQDIDLQNDFGYTLLSRSIKDKSYTISAYLLDQGIPTKINGLEIKKSSIKKIQRKEKVKKIQNSIKKFIKKPS